MLFDRHLPPAVTLSRVRLRAFWLFLAFLLLALLLTFVLSLHFVPIWQSVGGAGKVTRWDPISRPQTVDALIGGRVVRWHVRDGEIVRKGQPLAQLEDVDPKFLDPQLVNRTRDVLNSYVQKLQLARQRLAVVDEQRRALDAVRVTAVNAADRKLFQSQDRVRQSRQTVVLSEENLTTDVLQLNRVDNLEVEGLKSRRDLELSRQSTVRSETELERNRLALRMALVDARVAQLDLQRTAAQYRNELAKLAENRLKTVESIRDAEANVAKARIELSNLALRRQQQLVNSPMDGRVVKILENGTGETVKPGDALCTLVPTYHDPAVEITIGDFDAPLVRPGQRARLMFDGFPAVPFVGYPWAARGTYPGVVAAVDANADEKGKYRVVIRPVVGDLAWPGPDERVNYPLRLGTQVQGWIVMEQPVPLYWEIWRRLSAFPPLPVPGDKNDVRDKYKESGPKPVFKR